MVVSILFIFLWLISWTIAVHKFKVNDEGETDQTKTKVFLLFFAPFFNLFVLVWFGLQGYLSDDWNNLDK